MRFGKLASCVCEPTKQAPVCFGLCVFTSVVTCMVLHAEQMGTAWVWSTETWTLFSWSLVQTKQIPWDLQGPALVWGQHMSGWHKHTLNRCVIQIWAQIAALGSASFSLESSVTAIRVVQVEKWQKNRCIKSLKEKFSVFFFFVEIKSKIWGHVLNFHFVLNDL